jgi:hypothetical protein
MLRDYWEIIIIIFFICFNFFKVLSKYNVNQFFSFIELFSTQYIYIYIFLHDRTVEDTIAQLNYKYLLL